jgi:serine/threonine-protein kinase
MFTASSLPTFSNGELIRDTYTIVRYLGGGAFGNVYLARHRYMGLQAMKIFALDKAKSALDEAFLLAKLQHPNIVRMFEANDFPLEKQEYGYFTMEYVDGGTLAAWNNEWHDFSQKIDVARQLITGLAHAHAQNPPIIHRDVKPTNMLIEKTRGTVPKISDFGLAKAVDLQSKLASAAGTMIYMAPEGFEGHESTASDVYSLGMTLFELLTGKHPFSLRIPEEASQRTVSLLVESVRRQKIQRASGGDEILGSEWDEFFENVLAFRPDARPARAIEMLDLFEATVSKSHDAISTESTARRAVAEALQAAHRGDLTAALELLISACKQEPKLADEYGYLLDLWKRGIVQ